MIKVCYIIVVEKEEEAIKVQNVVKFVDTSNLLVLPHLYFSCSILSIIKPLTQRLLCWEGKFVLWSKVDEFSYQ